MGSAAVRAPRLHLAGEELAQARRLIRHAMANKPEMPLIEA